MDFTFLKNNGEVAFFRDDAEQADWIQEELNLNCVFPYVAEKMIERGMVILFQDPATNNWQAYEIRQCVLMPGESYQQITAEDLAVSELSDCHIQEKIELTKVTPSSALTKVLSGTGWSVGTVEKSTKSSGDVQRGAVWSAVQVITENWNVYIMPRVTVGSNGITGRFLDILNTDGYDRGLRLAINKNMTDPCVTYDDTELYTALYGYGGTYTDKNSKKDKTKEYNFADVVWKKTADHPAKKKGQKYIEDPDATALYGRNGKPRFGYYQNTQIKDPEVLLEKTWESLKQCRKPKINIQGTVTDLKRFGYTDVPIRLHDLAIVELEPVGLQFYLQVIQNTVDLLDATKTLPTIGDYIPNIIYINRKTDKNASGGGGGGGRGPSTKTDLELDTIRTDWYDTDETIGMYGQVLDEHGNILQQCGLHIDPKTGVLIYATDNANMIGSKFNVAYDRISAEVTDRKSADREMSGKIEVMSNKISLVVTEKNGRNVVNTAQIVLGINNQTGSYALIQARTINLSGYTKMDDFSALNGTVNGILAAGTFGSNRITSAVINATSTLAASGSFNYKGHSIGAYACTTNGGATFYALGYG